LPKGTGRIALTFDGYKISDASNGKSLDIGKVGISCGGSRQVTHLERPIALPPFPQGAFVKAAPGFELVAVERLGSVERGKIPTMFLRIETQGGFDQTVDLSIEGLPDGVEARGFPRNVPKSQVQNNGTLQDLYHRVGSMRAAWFTVVSRVMSMRG
jgi:hypothetical protein